MSPRRRGTLATFAVAFLLGSSTLAATTSETAVAATGPDRSITVSGTDTATYPAADPAVSRYAVTTTSTTGGSLTITATTTDPRGTVHVDGRLVGATTTRSGLAPGDEVTVRIDDAGGTLQRTYVYLPVGFPALQRVTPLPAAGALAPGLTLLTLQGTPSSPGGPATLWETAVDVNGVPAVASNRPGSMDLQRQPNGRYSVARPTTTPGRTGSGVVELDDRFREVARHETRGLVNTDGHDAILEPDGTAWLMAYEPNNATGKTDAIVQRIDPDGSVGFQWTSAPYAAEEVVAPDNPDYAHINSLALTADGDLLASFRHLSAVFRIATHAHDGFAVGDVVWKLGGRDSSFAITGLDGLPDGGPCAQHTARELANGNILLFDNGSSQYFAGKLCIDPADPTGPTVDRPPSRVVEFALDPAAGTARVVRSYSPGDRYTIFAGSAQQVANGNRVIGWAASPVAVASEISADGSLLWELRDPKGAAISYRAHRTTVPDLVAPSVTVGPGSSGATYVQGDAATADFTCTDTGGSSLASCSATTASGAALDTTTPGSHEVTVTAVDGAGNRTTATGRYTVLAAYGPDAVIGRSRLTLPRAGAHRTTRVVVRNAGLRPDAFRLTVTPSTKRFRVTYAVNGARVPAAGLLTRVLAPGEQVVVSVRVTRTQRARKRDRSAFTLGVTSTGDPSRGDAVRWVARAR